MSAWLRQLFRLQPGEGGRVALFALLGALLQCGLAIGLSTVDSLFLAHIGIGRLPVIYVLTPFVMLIYIPVYSLLITRLGIERVFQLTLGVLTAGGIVFGSIFLALGLETAPAPIYYCAKLYTAVWWIALYTLYWNFADNYFDILDAKRLYSLFSGASAAGAGIGGIIVTELSRYLEVPQLFLAWAVLALLAVPVLFLILRHCRSLEDQDDPAETRHIGLVEQSRVMADAVRRSRYVVLLIGILFLTLVVTAVCEYRYMGVFSTARTDRQLAGLFGELYTWVSIFNLVVTLLVFNRLVARIGVRNTALIQPLAYLGVFLWFLLDDSLTPALLGFFAYQGLLVTVDYNNVNFLLNALPAENKKQVRTFIEGICEPLSTATAGIFLLFFAKALGPDKLALCGLLLAIVFLALVLFLRVEYVRAMIVNLKRGWLDFSRSLPQLVRGSGPAELDWLAETARRAPSAEALLAIRLLWLADKHRAADCLLEFITPPDAVRCRAAQPLLARMLADGDHDLIRQVLAWLDRCHDPLPPALLEELGHRGLIATQDLKAYLQSAAPAPRAAAAAALAHSWKVADGAVSLQTLNRLLKGSAADRRAAIAGIGHSGQSRFVHFLVPVLQSGAADERLEALLAVRRLAGRDSTRLLPSILQVVVNGPPGERACALEILDQLGDPDSIPPLLDASEDFSPRALRQTEALLLGIGLRGVPAVVSYLLEPGRPYSGRSLAARTLAQVSFTQFETIYPDLIEGEITRAYAFLERQARLAGAATPGRAVLGRFYRDMPETVIDFILELLGLGGRLPDFESIAASLRSRNPKDRANAIETVEQACRRATFARLVPLLDGRSLDDKLAAGRRQQAARLELTEEEIVAAACASRFLIEAAAGLQAVWEATPGRTREAIQERIAASPHPGLRGVLLALLERLDESGGAPEPTLVEKVHALTRSSLFARLRVQELVLLGTLARFATPDGKEAAGCGLVLAGEADVRRGTEVHTVHPGETWGESSLWQPGGAPVIVAARHLRALVFSPDEVRQLARHAPRIAVALLRQKWEAGHAA